MWMLQDADRVPKRSPREMMQPDFGRNWSSRSGEVFAVIVDGADRMNGRFPAPTASDLLGRKLPGWYKLAVSAEAYNL